MFIAISRKKNGAKPFFRNMKGSRQAILVEEKVKKEDGWNKENISDNLAMSVPNVMPR